MKQENINTNKGSEEKYLAPRQGESGKLRVLVAPLDWGLGHATRCIPVIYELIRQNCEVWLAAEGDQEVLLRQEFPQLRFLPLRGYRVKYGYTAFGNLWNIIAQSGKILRAIRYEKNWLKKMISTHGFDAVISDNRYGLWDKDIPCIFITHQLSIRSPFGKCSESLLQKRNYKYINRFKECWIPDSPGANDLAGELSHPKNKPAIPLVYTAPISRFEKIVDHSGKPCVAEQGSLLIILSGPEPQRSIFENKIIRDVVHYHGAVTFVRGLPANSTIIPSTNSIKFYNHLSSRDLNQEMNRAEYIISRSGYSSIMDIAKLNKKSILVPTPGQTEQEYLAKYLSGKKIAISFSQKSFSLTKAVAAAKSFSYELPGMKNNSTLQQTISKFIVSLRHG